MLRFFRHSDETRKKEILDLIKKNKKLTAATKKELEKLVLTAPEPAPPYPIHDDVGGH
jgi:hypothetical protein